LISMESLKIIEQYFKEKGEKVMPYKQIAM
jgi:hypothetical protein